MHAAGFTAVRAHQRALILCRHNGAVMARIEIWSRQNAWYPWRMSAGLRNQCSIFLAAQNSCLTYALLTCLGLGEPAAASRCWQPSGGE